MASDVTNRSSFDDTISIWNSEDKIPNEAENLDYLKDEKTEIIIDTEEDSDNPKNTSEKPFLLPTTDNSNEAADELYRGFGPANVGYPPAASPVPAAHFRNPYFPPMPLLYPGGDPGAAAYVSQQPPPAHMGYNFMPPKSSPSPHLECPTGRSLFSPSLLPFPPHWAMHHPLYQRLPENYMSPELSPRYYGMSPEATSRGAASPAPSSPCKAPTSPDPPKPLTSPSPSSIVTNLDKKVHIKKPLNAFMLFMKEQRAIVMKEYTLKESAAINQVLGKKWHSLSKEEQKKYYDLAKEERLLHQQLHPGWSARDNYAQNSKRRKRRREKMIQDGTTNSGAAGEAGFGKKCRARYGLEKQDEWCNPCKRKKKCIRFSLGGDDSEGEAPTPDSTAYLPSPSPSPPAALYPDSPDNPLNVLRLSTSSVPVT